MVAIVLKINKNKNIKNIKNTVKDTSSKRTIDKAKLENDKQSRMKF